MESLKKLISNKKIEINPFCLYLFFINLLSSLSVTVWFDDCTSIISIYLMSSFITLIESLFCSFFPNKIKKGLYFLIIFILTLLLTIDWGCRFVFHKVISIDLIDIAAETNLSESLSFCSTYVFEILAGVILVGVMSFVLYLIVKRLSAIRYLYYLIVISALVGALYVSYATYNWVKYDNGISMPQYSTITRTVHGLLISEQNAKHNLKVLDVCKNVKAIKMSKKESPNIIVVIGESYSCFHTPLYTYSLNTNPFLMKRKEKGELVVFDDVVSVSDHTHGVMESVFSLSKSGHAFSESSLFPTCFKMAGFYTALYENQYFVSKSRLFLSDKTVSEIMFEERNKEGSRYDGELIQSINFKDSNSLVVIHLMGQHYTYKDRYPNQFEKFSALDYKPEKPERQRNIIAAYDNATLYNDYVMEQLIKKIETTNSILIYFSDHGEEIYECRNYMGHGDAAHSPNIKYQMRVPFMIWMSNRYKELYPEKVEAVVNARSLPIITDDVSHFLLDLADISTKELDYSRSFINENYKIPNPRIVLHSIPFEERLKKQN